MINTYPLLVGGISNGMHCPVNDGRPFVIAYPPISKARHPGARIPDEIEVTHYVAKKFRDSRLNFGKTTYFMYCHESASDAEAIAVFKNWKKLP